MSEMSRRTQDAWTLTYDHWLPEQQPLREALCTLGNGYICTRGAAEEACAGGVHYPGTYLAGGYNRLLSEVSGRVIENEDLVNWPNWLALSFRVEEGEWFEVTSAEVLDFRQSLDLRRGVLERQIRFCDSANRRTSLISRRLVHMGNPHLAALHWTLKPENWSGRVEIRTALDGGVSNQGVERYRDLNSQHLETLETGSVDEDGVYLAVQTNQSHLCMVQAARTRVFSSGKPAGVERETMLVEGQCEQRIATECQSQQPLTLEKVVSVYTSRDFAISHPKLAACETIQRAESFDELLLSHQRTWRRLWSRADMEIETAAPSAQLILRLHVFHLLQTVSWHSIDQDNGVPARGWHGEAYRGHIFWDELFIFPFLNLRIPELTRSLLMYRHRRLPTARRLAADEGYHGAMFPWQSGSSGREESQILHLNPQSGRWIEDNTHRQRHINAAIAYNVWQYFQATGDVEFLSSYGVELLIEIARFWASIAFYNEQRDRFEIRRVAGPDEFHTQYPDTGNSDQQSHGLNNNAYTNVMAVWVLRTAPRALELLAHERRAEIIDQLQLSSEELQHWDRVSRKMFVPFHHPPHHSRHDGPRGNDPIISQFEGYEKLEEFDWREYREKHSDLQRLDRILEAEGDSPNRYQVSKQADVLMLFYLFSSEELCSLLKRLGYSLSAEAIPKNINYYLQRTSHGSTLSRVVHSWVLARSDRQHTWALFQQALHSDVDDIQGGTTAEGIHLGAMAGTVDLIQRCFTGVETRDDTLWLNPRLPNELNEIRLRLRYRGHWLRIVVTRRNLRLSVERGAPGAVKIGFRGQVRTLVQGDAKTFDCR